VLKRTFYLGSQLQQKISEGSFYKNKPTPNNEIQDSASLELLDLYENDSIPDKEIQDLAKKLETIMRVLPITEVTEPQDKPDIESGEIKPDDYEAIKNKLYALQQSFKLEFSNYQEELNGKIKILEDYPEVKTKPYLLDENIADVDIDSIEVKSDTPAVPTSTPTRLDKLKNLIARKKDDKVIVETLPDKKEIKSKLENTMTDIRNKMFSLIQTQIRGISENDSKFKLIGDKKITSNHHVDMRKLYSDLMDPLFTRGRKDTISLKTYTDEMAELTERINNFNLIDYLVTDDFSRTNSVPNS
jgi:hypothetical protein